MVRRLLTDTRVWGAVRLTASSRDTAFKDREKMIEEGALRKGSYPDLLPLAIPKEKVDLVQARRKHSLTPQLEHWPQNADLEHRQQCHPLQLRCRLKPLHHIQRQPSDGERGKDQAQISPLLRQVRRQGIPAGSGERPHPCAFAAGAAPAAAVRRLWSVFADPKEQQAIERLQGQLAQSEQQQDRTPRSCSRTP